MCVLRRSRGFQVLRVQMQTGGVQYKNTADAAVQIFRRSGLRQGLYAGISAAYLRQWTYGACRMGIYANLLASAQASPRPPRLRPPSPPRVHTRSADLTDTGVVCGQAANVAAGRDKSDISFGYMLGMGCVSGGVGPCSLWAGRMAT
jgi:hypothetical protein